MRTENSFGEILKNNFGRSRFFQKSFLKTISFKNETERKKSEIKEKE
jgi:hypothetical protein